MQKLLAKLLVFLLLVKIISPIVFIGQVFAVSNTWDFIDSANYTLSDTDINHIKIENSSVRLPYHLEHLWVLTGSDLDWARRVIVKWNYAFISSYDADTIVAIDISDPANPFIVDTIWDWDDWMDLNWPIGLAYTWTYLYVAWYLSDNINIIDISDPTNMTFVKEIADSSWDQQLNWVKDIQVYWDHLYAVAYNDDAFNVFDNSDPSDPQFLEDLKDSTKLDWANRAKIDWNYAYVAVDKNDSFEIIDLSNQDDSWQSISIVWEVNDWDNWALLDWARWVSFSWNLAYVASNISDAMEIIDITDKTNPIHTWSIANWWDIVLDANRQVILYNWFAFNSARTSDAIEVVNISDPTTPFHESNILASSEVLLDWANDIYNSGSIFYVASNVDDALEVLKVQYSNNSPYVIPNIPYNYTWSITSFSEILWINNEWNITYQISRDAWNTWYWFDWNEWQITSSWVLESNSALEINDHLYEFNKLNREWTWSFLFKAFLNSNWEQKVELDKVNITTVESPKDISDPVFWYDWQDVDWDWDPSNDPSAGSEVLSVKDKFNWFDTSSTWWQAPIYDTWWINNHSNLLYDWVDDYYSINDNDLINTSDYYEKSFSIVFKTSDDVDTFQNIYEQWGTARWYVIQIENGHLYAWVFNNVEREEWDQYKFVDLWNVNENQTYYVTMIQESTNSKTFKVYLDSNLVWELWNVDYQRSHWWDIWLWFVNGNTLKASDSSKTSGPAYFKWNIWEFISWNHALTDNERLGIDMYLKNKWDLDFKVYPVILSSSIVNNQLLTDWNFDFYFTYKDWDYWPWIDTGSVNVELYKWDPNNSSWGDDISWSWIILNSVTEFTWSFSANNLEMGDYKMIFSVSNNDWNTAFKEVLFSVDPIWVPEKIYHFDAQNIDWDFDDTNEPSNWDLIPTWNDIKNNYDANQATDDYKATYKINTINKYPSLSFDWVDDYYWINNEDDINTSTFEMKSFSMILKTGDDVTNFQNIYEQWGWYRGYAIQIESWHLYMWAWNTQERDDGHQFKFVDLWEINPNEIYNILLVQDSTVWVDTEDVIKAYIDWKLAWELDHVDKQYSHPWDIVLWKNHDWRKYDWGSLDDGYYFKWNIWEFISWNYILTWSDIDNLNNYLVWRWSLDKIAPVISWTNILSGSILPGWDHNIEFYYSDTWEYWTGVWININSWNIILERWDSWNSNWVDVSDKIWTGTITETWAVYPMLDLDYWKYRVKFSIADNNWNISDIFENTFYIDRPELIISTWSINIWKLNDSSITFWDDLIVTVKTIWAPFRVKLQKNTGLTHSNWDDFIPYYDWSIGMWYDKNDDGNLSDFNNDIILSDSGSLNTDWELNTYTYTLKMWAIIDKLQAWWDYTWKIDFGIELDY